MKVLLVCAEPAGSFGGVQSYARNLCRGLLQIGHRALLVTPGGVYEPGVTVMPQGEFMQPRTWYRLLSEYRPDLVHLVDWQSQFHLHHLFSGMPYVTSVFGAELLGVLRSPERKGRLLRALTSSLRIIAISKYTACLLFNTMGIKGAHIAYPGIDVARFSAPQRRHNPGPSAVTVARLVPRKGQDMVIRAWPQVMKAFPSATYVIVGTGPDEARLRAEAEKAKARVRFAGAVPCCSIAESYDLGQIYVMPCRQEGNSVEGFGLTFIEAGARGLAVVGGRHGGAEEAVVHGKTGYLVQPFDTGELAQCIIRLLRDERLRDFLGEYGRARAKSEFDLAVSANRAYAGLLS
ncbi:MAG: glycosyltransferase family 4 protein [Bacillota bacterium]